jgi:hypothetical protein
MNDILEIEIPKDKPITLAQVEDCSFFIDIDGCLCQKCDDNIYCQITDGTKENNLFGMIHNVPYEDLYNKKIVRKILAIKTIKFV